MSVMADISAHSIGAEIWALAREQHGVVTREQLRARGYTDAAITHRVERGRLHPVFRATFAVGRPMLTQRGRWLAAVLSCGSGSALCHHDAAALLGLREPADGAIHVSVANPICRRQRSLRAHRRLGLEQWITVHDRIPVTAPALTLVDIASDLPSRALEAAVNEADGRDLIHVDELRDELEALRGRPGVAKLRRLIDRRTFRLTGSELERYFLPIARQVGLGPPQTQVYVNGWRVDFFWPQLGLVVETDSLRYHRTPAQQDRDRRRDQAHLAAGMTPVRVTHAQIRFEPGYVRALLTRVVARIRNRSSK
jgi:very-short-patch-repair endonuclease